MPAPRPVARLLVLLVAAYPAALAARPVAAETIETDVAGLVRGVDRWVVAIEVAREKDVPQPRVPGVAPVPGRSGEIREYFQRPQGFVTGFLVDSAGHVVTSHYNVAGELKGIRVRFFDGSERSARLVAIDPIDDLALLRLDGDGPPWLGSPWEDPPWSDETPSPGRVVLSIGRSPDPMRLTVTTGIISAATRNGERTLQTDAKLNYGNVGGPLLDLDGRVVGITGFVGHTQPLWGLNSGIGFAARAGVVKEVLEVLRTGKNFSLQDPPFLGIRSDTDTAVEGAPVVAVVPGSPAAAAGLVPDDVIVEFGGAPIPGFAVLRRRIFASRIGATVDFRVRRAKEILDLKITIGKRPQRL